MGRARPDSRDHRGRGPGHRDGSAGCHGTAVALFHIVLHCLYEGSREHHSGLDLPLHKITTFLHEKTCTGLPFLMHA
jgi:hypothetical protein